MSLNRRLSPRKNRLKLHFLPFKSASPEELNDMSQKSDASPDSPIWNGNSKYSTLPRKSSSCISPPRAKTMKEYDQVITDLKKENFNLKLRIYFLEEKMCQKYGASSDHLHIYKTNLELKVETESLKKDLADKLELLSQASGALETLETQHEINCAQLEERAQKQKHELEEQIEAMSKHFSDSSPSKAISSSQESMLHKKNEQIQKLSGNLKLEKEQSYKRDKTIQGLAEVIKLKETENQELQKRLKRQEKTIESAKDRILSNSINSTNLKDSSDHKDLKASLESFRGEAQRNLDSHDEVVKEKDALIEHLQKSIIDLENILEAKINNSEEKEKNNLREVEISTLKIQVKDKDMQLEEISCKNKLIEEDKVEKVKSFEDKIVMLLKDLNKEKENCKTYQKSCAERENDVESINIILAAKDQEIKHMNENLSENGRKIVSEYQKILADSRLDAQKNEDKYKKEMKVLSETIETINQKMKVAMSDGLQAKEDNEMRCALLREKERELNERDSEKASANVSLSKLEKSNKDLLLQSQSVIALMKNGEEMKKELENVKSINKALEIRLDNVNEDLLKSREEKVPIIENKLDEDMTKKLALAEDTIYSQKLKLDFLMKHLASFGFDSSVLNESSKMNSSSILNTPPQKLSPSPPLIERLSLPSLLNADEEVSSDRQRNISRLSDQTHPSRLHFNDSRGFNCDNSLCREHRKEILDLRARLMNSLHSCETLECHLEEIADFLERLLNYDDYNGHLTPQQVMSLKKYLSESRDLSQNLSLTLLGGIDASIMRKSMMSCDESSRCFSPNIRSLVKNAHEIDGHSKVTFASVEKCRDIDVESEANSASRRSLPSFNGQDKLFKEPLPKFRTNILQSEVSMFKPSPMSEKSLEPVVRGDSYSESDDWSEPDRNVSLQRIGLDSSFLQPQSQCDSNNRMSTTDSNTAVHVACSLSGSAQGAMRSKSDTMLQKLESKLLDMQQLNDSLKAELSIYHNINLEKQACENMMPDFMNKHLEAIRALHEKLEKTIQTNEHLKQALEDQVSQNSIAEVEKLRARVIHQEQRYQQVCSANAELQEKFIQKCQEVDKERSFCVQAEQQLIESEQSIKSLQLVKENFENRTQKLTDQLSGLANLKTVNEDLQKRLRNNSCLITELNTKINEYDGDLRNVKDRNGDLQSEICAKNESINVVQSDVMRYREDVAKKDNILTQIKQEFISIQNVLTSKESAIDGLRKDNEKLKKHLEVQVAERELKINDQNMALGSEIDRLKNELSNVLLSKAKLKNEVKILRSKVQEFSEFNLQDNREISSRQSENFTHIPYGESITSRSNSDATEMERLTSRVSDFLNNENMIDFQSNRWSSKSYKSQEVNQKRIDQSSSREDKVRPHSIHYSSPDLGIDSDPNNHDGKDSVYSTMDEDVNPKYSDKKSRNDDINTDEIRRIVLGSGSEDCNLYVISPLVQHELLKKEVVESLFIVSNIHSRTKDRLEAYLKNSPSEEVDVNTFKILDSSCQNMETCLNKSSALLLSFPIFDISTLRHNLQETTEELINKNCLLEEELKNLKMLCDKQKRDLDDAFKRLTAAQKKKKGMEKAITKQLNKTTQVLRQAKSNLQRPES